MQSLPFQTKVSLRSVANLPSITLRNRFAEQNTLESESGVACISRPGLRKFTEVGTGHIRKCFAQPGVFNDDLFVVSGTDLWRVTPGGTKTNLGTISTSVTGSVSMCCTAPLSDTTPAHLFIAEGGILWCWTDNGQALGHMNATGTIASGDTVAIDGVYYQFTSTSVDTGTPTGTSGSPWLVNIGAANVDSLTNLYNAINLSGVAGTDYSTTTTAPLKFFAYAYTGTDLYVSAIDAGSSGNSLTLAATGGHLAWSASSMSGGGSNMLRQVQVPDDVGAVSVATINSFVIVIPQQLANIKGRFYFIQPAETKIDPLDFATAERSPDGLYQVVVFGDMFWLMGQDTTEPWVTTGDPAAPMQRFQGILYDRGTWNGTAVQVKDSIILVDQHGGVFQIAGKQTRISTPDIEEPIRRALQKSALLT